jgi:hypothetical protein
MAYPGEYDPTQIGYRPDIIQMGLPFQSVWSATMMPPAALDRWTRCKR